MNTEEQQSFADGTKLKKEEDATHLGNTLNNRADTKTEVQQKIQEAQITLNNQESWTATEASKKWKILNLDMEWRSKLLYGLEAAELTDASFSKIDAIQIRGLRNILSKKGTHWDRRQQTKSFWPKQLKKLTRVAMQKTNKKQKQSCVKVQYDA